MNGRIDDKLSLDTNAIITWTDNNIRSPYECGFPVETMFFASVITEMELLSCPNLTAEDEQVIRAFLKDVTVIPLTDSIKDEATAIRRFGKPCPKLPDAIIAATAVLLGATLVTDDDKLLKLEWPGLQTFSIR
jgi:predicted nucleic acid-binding protein